MKLIFTILLFMVTSAKASNYYVANAGSDANIGTSIGAAWQTIAKINASTFNPGDSIFFNSGDTWNERLVFPSSGNASSIIYIGSYGTGNMPIITGLQSLTGFTNVSNIWTAKASNSVKNLNTVLISGLIKAKARAPNTGYITFTSYSGNNQITGSLSGTPNFTGGECVVRVAPWIIDAVKITSQSGGTLNLSPGLTYSPPAGGVGYFIQNINSALDIPGEWTFDSTTKAISVYSTTSPIVQISTIDTLVWLRGNNYLTFSNLSFNGANKAAFQFDTCNNITLSNCSINYSGTIALSALKSPHLNIINDSIQNSLSGAIYFRQVDPYTPAVNACDSAIISGNYIKNTAIYPGMGLNNNGRYNAISVLGLNTNIYNNYVDSTGYLGIVFGGTNSIIRNNYIDYAGLLKSDGAAIYTVVGTYLPSGYNDGSKIVSNIITNGIRSSAGTSTSLASSQNAGIYSDNFSRYITIDSNFVYNCTSGYYMNDNTYMTVRNNTFVNNLDNQMVLNASAVVGSMYFTKNSFYSATATLLVDLSGFSATSNFGVLDSNFYSNPIDETKIVKFSTTTYNIGGWQSFSGKDANSVGTPGTITNSATLIYYSISIPKTYPLTGVYIDIKGNYYSGSVTLPPYTSLILFKAVSDILPSYNIRVGVKYRKVH